MKSSKFHIILSIVLPLIIVGCTTDNRLDCFNETSLELRFEYDTGQQTPFTEVITAVDAILFNAEGIYLGHYRMEKDVLDNNRNVRKTIDPGSYFAIAWANVHDNAVYTDFVPGVTTLEDCLLEIPDTSTETGDPLYYAVRKDKPELRTGTDIPNKPETGVLNEITVPRGKSVVAEMGFVRAHRTINVWIQGYTDTNQPDLQPTVRANNLWTQYSFLFTTRPSKRTFTQVAQQKVFNGKVYSVVTFHSALGAIEEDVFIVVCSTFSGKAECTINLRQFIHDNKINNIEEINMLLIFYGTEFTVTLPKWEEKPVTPGIE